MRVIIAGIRTLESAYPVARAIRDSGFHITEVVSGGAKGADRFGELHATLFDIPLKKFPADWQTHGKAAGPIRNEEMARYADALIAVWDGKSRGTKNMIETARKHGLKIYVYSTVSPVPTEALPISTDTPTQEKKL